MEILAVVAVTVCAALYAIADFIKRRRRHKFNEELRRYIQKHKEDSSFAMRAADSLMIAMIKASIFSFQIIPAVCRVWGWVALCPVRPC